MSLTTPLEAGGSKRGGQSLTDVGSRVLADHYEIGEAGVKLSSPLVMAQGRLRCER